MFRPALVIPSELRALLGPEEIRMALSHELAHFKRRDLAWSAMAAMVRALFFFHPLVWWASRRMELAQEIAADQLALRRFPGDLARFAESNGYAFDKDRPAAYHYRDFVIKAFNEDMPYDRFVRLQIPSRQPVWFHLDEVEIFAADDPETNIALNTITPITMQTHRIVM